MKNAFVCLIFDQKRKMFLSIIIPPDPKCDSGPGQPLVLLSHCFWMDWYNWTSALALLWLIHQAFWKLVRKFYNVEWKVLTPSLKLYSSSLFNLFFRTLAFSHFYSTLYALFNWLLTFRCVSAIIFPAKKLFKIINKLWQKKHMFFTSLKKD